VTRIGRRPWLKWPLRALLALAASEATLALGALVIEERGAGDGKAIPAGCILCVGDSHTQGIGASPGHSYPAQLQELLRAAGDPREVVNLGVAGFDSRQALDALEDALAQAKPSCVLYLAGNNDRNRSLSLLATDRTGGTAAPAAEGSRSVGAALDGALSWLRTWRMARTAWRVATGDVGHHEIGGAAERRLPPPQNVEASKWNEEYARAKAAGTIALAEWVEQFWVIEDPTWMRVGWNDLRAAPDFDRLVGVLRQPTAAYEWELDALEGKPWSAPPCPIENPDENHAFLVVARALSAWSEGGLAAMRAVLDQPEEVAWALKANPWAALYFDLYRGFSRIVAREWDEAAPMLAAGLARTKSISPRVGRPCFEGGAALAQLFADDASASGSPSAPSCIRDPDGWHVAYWSADLPNGREWMAVAEIAEGARAGLGSPAHEAGRRRAHERFQEPRTLPLRWLYDHPDATFEQIRAEMPLEPPRIGWWGIRRFLFRNVDADEYRRIATARHERLAGLARRDGFDAVALCYVIEDFPMFNALQRELAATRGWPLADVHSRFTRAELEADDRKRYFSADRAHPNDAGYALMAREAFDALQRLRSGGAAGR